MVAGGERAAAGLRLGWAGMRPLSQNRDARPSEQMRSPGTPDAHPSEQMRSPGTPDEGRPAQGGAAATNALQPQPMLHKTRPRLKVSRGMPMGRGSRSAWHCRRGVRPLRGWKGDGSRKSMKLEAKLGSTYGILILAMLATSTVAYLRMTQVNHIIGKFISEQIPVVYSNRGARVSLGKSDRFCWTSGCSTARSPAPPLNTARRTSSNGPTRNDTWRNCAIWRAGSSWARTMAASGTSRRRQRSCTHCRTALRT